MALIAILFGKNSSKREFSERIYLVANVVLDVFCAACWIAVETRKREHSLPLMLATTVTTFGASFVWWRLLTWRRSCWLSVVKAIKIAAFGCVWTIGAVIALQFRERIEPIWRGLTIGVGVVTLVSFAFYLRGDRNRPNQNEIPPAVPHKR